jgi:methyl-accepting chemotaxis protein
MFSTISGRMTAILAALALLLGAGALASHIVLKRQADDGLIVNLAGRQRMLTQKMTKESAQLVNAAHDHNDLLVADMRDQVQNTMRAFEMTLFALRSGGPAPINLDMTRMRETPPASTPEIAKQLDAVVAAWEPFKKHMGDLVHSNGGDGVAANAVMATNVMLLTQMNKAVDLMQEDSEQKVKVLYVVQIGALALGLVLVGVGVWVAHATIARPLRDLADAARAMTKGDLNVKLEANGAAEVKELAASFDRMRASMVAALGGGLDVKGVDDDL